MFVNDESVTDFLRNGGDSPSNGRRSSPARIDARVPQQLQARSLYCTHAADLRRFQRHLHEGA